MDPTRSHWYGIYSMVELSDERCKQHVSSYARHVKSKLGRQRDLRQLSLRLRTLPRPSAWTS
eukprot:5558771-Pyramimonas_sp.AAC.1